MKSLTVVLLCYLAIPSLCMGEVHAANRKINLRSGTGEVVVPEGKIWEIRRLKPYESANNVGTADLYVNGEIFIGKDKGYTISGKFYIGINKMQSSSI